MNDWINEINGTKQLEISDNNKPLSSMGCSNQDERRENELGKSYLEVEGRLVNEMGKTKSYGTKLRNALRNQRTSKRRPLSTLDAQQKTKILK